ncbi:MAG: hypothetical protein KGJ06_00145 [Pseudomonadota bacterium]|nr:hypothetical protein [Pseudomonadota bacterium]
MLGMNLNDATVNLGYQARRGGIYAVAKPLLHSVSDVVAQPLQEVVAPAAPGIMKGIGASATMLPGAGMLLTMGLTAGLSAGLTQMDYNKRIAHLRDSIYARELSSKLGKPADQITADDVESVKSKVISEHVGKLKRQRNFGVALSFIASMAGLALVGLTLGFAHEPMWHSMEALGGGLLRGAVGLMAYLTVKQPIHWVAEKTLGLEKETAHDRIETLKRNHEAGKIISPEEIAAVYTKVHPELDHVVLSEFGAHFDKLNLADRQKATMRLAEILPLAQLTQDINSGKVNVTELAFAVEGQASGINNHLNPQPQKQGFVRAALNKLRRVSGRPEITPGMQAAEAIQSAQAIAQPILQEQGRPAHSFVQQLGLKPREAGLTHVQQLSQPPLAASGIEGP